MIWPFFKETVLVILFWNISVTGDDILQYFQPTAGLPEELNEWLSIVQQHKDDFSLIRNAAQNYKTDPDELADEFKEKINRKRDFSHLHLDEIDHFEDEPMNNYPKHNIYPYMYQNNDVGSQNYFHDNTTQNEAVYFDNVQPRIRRDSNKTQKKRHDIQAKYQSHNGVVERSEVKYPGRYKNKYSNNINKRDVQIEVLNNGKLIKQITDNSADTKSIVVNIQAPEESKTPILNKEIMVNPSYINEHNNENHFKNLHHPKKNAGLSSRSLKPEGKEEVYSNYRNLFTANEHLYTDRHPIIYHVTLPNIESFLQNSTDSVVANSQKSEYNKNSFNKNGLQDMSKYWTATEKQMMQKGIEFAQKYKNFVNSIRMPLPTTGKDESDGFEKIQSVVIDDNKQFNNKQNVNQDKQIDQEKYDGDKRQMVVSKEQSGREKVIDNDYREQPRENMLQVSLLPSKNEEYVNEQTVQVDINSEDKSARQDIINNNRQRSFENKLQEERFNNIQHIGPESVDFDNREMPEKFNAFDINSQLEEHQNEINNIKREENVIKGHPPVVIKFDRDANKRNMVIDPNNDTAILNDNLSNKKQILVVDMDIDNLITKNQASVNKHNSNFETKEMQVANDENVNSAISAGSENYLLKFSNINSKNMEKRQLETFDKNKSKHNIIYIENNYKRQLDSSGSKRGAVSSDPLINENSGLDVALKSNIPLFFAESFIPTKEYVFFDVTTYDDSTGETLPMLPEIRQKFEENELTLKNPGEETLKAVESPISGDIIRENCPPCELNPGESLDHILHSVPEYNGTDVNTEGTVVILVKSEDENEEEEENGTTDHGKKHYENEKETHHNEQNENEDEVLAKPHNKEDYEDEKNEQTENDKKTLETNFHKEENENREDFEKDNKEDFEKENGEDFESDSKEQIGMNENNSELNKEDLKNVDDLKYEKDEEENSKHNKEEYVNEKEPQQIKNKGKNISWQEKGEYERPTHKHPKLQIKSEIEEHKIVTKIETFTVVTSDNENEEDDVNNYDRELLDGKEAHLRKAIPSNISYFEMPNIDQIANNVKRNERQKIKKYYPLNKKNLFMNRKGQHINRNKDSKHLKKHKQTEKYEDVDVNDFLYAVNEKRSKDNKKKPKTKNKKQKSKNHKTKSRVLGYRELNNFIGVQKPFAEPPNKNSDSIPAFISRQLKAFDYVYDPDLGYPDLKDILQKGLMEDKSNDIKRKVTSERSNLHKDSIEGDYGDEEDSVSNKKQQDFKLVKKTDNEFAHPVVATEAEEEYYNDEYEIYEGGRSSTAKSKGPSHTLNNSKEKVYDSQSQKVSFGKRMHKRIKEPEKTQQRPKKVIEQSKKNKLKKKDTKRNIAKNFLDETLLKNSDFQQWPKFVRNNEQNEEILKKRSLVYGKKHPRGNSFPLSTKNFFLMSPKNIEESLLLPKREKIFNRAATNIIENKTVAMKDKPSINETKLQFTEEKDIKFNTKKKDVSLETMNKPQSSDANLLNNNSNPVDSVPTLGVDDVTVAHGVTSTQNTETNIDNTTECTEGGPKVSLTNACEDNGVSNQTEFSMSTVLPIVPDVESITFNSYEPLEKVDELMDGKIPFRIVDDILKNVKANKNFKEKFQNGLKQNHKPGYFNNIRENSEEETRKTIAEMSNLINKLAITTNCEILPTKLRYYLKLIATSPKQDVLARANEMEGHPPDDNQNQDTQRPYLFESQSRADKLSEKVQVLKDLLQKFNGLPEQCKPRAMPVKEYIENHLGMLNNFLVNDEIKTSKTEINNEYIKQQTDGTKVNMEKNKKEAISSGEADDSERSLIERNLQSLGLGKNQQFKPKFNLDDIINKNRHRKGIFEEDDTDDIETMSKKSFKRDSGHHGPSRKFRKLREIIEKQKRKEIREKRLAQMYGKLDDEDVEYNDKFKRGDKGSFEAPLVYSF